MSEALQCIPIFYYISKSLLFFYSYFFLCHHQHHPPIYNLTLNTPHTHTAQFKSNAISSNESSSVWFHPLPGDNDDNEMKKNYPNRPASHPLSQSSWKWKVWMMSGDHEETKGEYIGGGWRWNTKKLNENGYRNVRLPHRNKKNWIFLLLFLPFFFVHFHFCCCISTFFLIYNIARVLDRKKWHL